MLVTREELARIVGNTLAMLEAEGLDSAEDLAAAVGEGYGEYTDAAHGGEEYIEVLPHPRSPSSLVVRYFRRAGQVPLQIIVNQVAGTLRVVLTCVDPLDGFEVLDEEPACGLLQDRLLPGLDVDELKRELRALAGDGGSDRLLH